jgi:hypothetical protein
MVGGLEVELVLRLRRLVLWLVLWPAESGSRGTIGS